jgi:hypothetical protein
MYRKQGVWLSRATAERVDDAYHAAEPPLLHSHSKRHGHKRLNTKSQQKVSQWSHGTLRKYIAYKAEAAGIAVNDTVSEADTTKTCPNPECTHQHKPKGRIYCCPTCGLVALVLKGHRDVVGAVNILSRLLHGEVGLLSPPRKTKYRHPYKRRGTHRSGKRRPQDTGQVAGTPTQHPTGDSRPQLSQNRRNSREEKRAAFT